MSEDNIKVTVKVRPLIKREKDNKLISLWRVNGNTIQHVEQPMDVPFVFDHIFDEDARTQDVFDTVAKPIVDASLKGFNGTIFAYGQTSSGKTHTMCGDANQPGITMLAIREIFKEIESSVDRQFLLRVGYIEIYNEKIFDLLDKTNVDLKIQERTRGDVTVNHTQHIVNNEKRIMDLLQEGNKERRTGGTNMNERSSRSHTIFRFIIESSVAHEDGDAEDRVFQTSYLNLVDLAGSERADQSGATGSRLKEAGNINKSLLSLSCVIHKLSENDSAAGFINYRDSKLTRLLQASLGGNAMTAIICNITPAANEETYSTLNFGISAKSIKNKPIVNEVLSDAVYMKKLQKEIQRLENELAEERLKNNSDSNSNLLQLKITEREAQFLTSSKSSKDLQKARRQTWCPPSSRSLLSDVKKMPARKFNAPILNTDVDDDLIFCDAKFVFDTNDENHLSANGRVIRSTSSVSSQRGSSLTSNNNNLLMTPRSLSRTISTPMQMKHRRSFSPINSKSQIAAMERELLELQDFDKLETYIGPAMPVTLNEETNILRSQLAIALELIEKYKGKNETMLIQALDSTPRKPKLSNLNDSTDDILIKTSVEDYTTAKNNGDPSTIQQIDNQNIELVKTNKRLMEMASDLQYEFDQHKVKWKNREQELLELIDSQTSTETKKQIPNFEDQLMAADSKIAKQEEQVASIQPNIDNTEIQILKEKIMELESERLDTFTTNDVRSALTESENRIQYLTADRKRIIDEYEALFGVHEKLQTEHDILSQQVMDALQENESIELLKQQLAEASAENTKLEKINNGTEVLFSDKLLEIENLRHQLSILIAENNNLRMNDEALKDGTSQIDDLQQMATELKLVVGSLSDENEQLVSLRQKNESIIEQLRLQVDQLNTETETLIVEKDLELVELQLQIEPLKQDAERLNECNRQLSDKLSNVEPFKARNDILESRIYEMNQKHSSELREAQEHSACIEEKNASTLTKLSNLLEVLQLIWQHAKGQADFQHINVLDGPRFAETVHICSQDILIELDSLRDERHVLQQELSDLANRCEAFELHYDNEVFTLRNNFSEVDLQLGAIEQQYHALSVTLESAPAESAVFSKQCKELIEQLSVSNDRVLSLEELHQELLSEKEENQKVLESIIAENLDKEDRIQALMQSAAGNDTQKMLEVQAELERSRHIMKKSEEDYNAVRQSYMDCMKQIDELQKEILQKQVNGHQLEEVTNELSTLKGRENVHLSRIKQLEDTISVFQSQLESSINATQKLSELEALQMDKYHQAEAAHMLAEQQLISANEKIATIEAQLREQTHSKLSNFTELEANVQSLKDEKKKYVEQLSELQIRCTTEGEKLHQVELQLIDSNNMCSTLRELQDNAQAQINEKLNKIQEMQESNDMLAKQLNSVTMLLNDLQTAETKIESLNSQEAEKNYELLQTKLTDAMFKIQEQQRTIEELAKTGELTTTLTTEKNALQTQLNATIQQYEQLEKEAKEAEQECTSLEAFVKKLQHEMDIMRKECGELFDQLATSIHLMSAGNLPDSLFNTALLDTVSEIAHSKNHLLEELYKFNADCSDMKMSKDDLEVRLAASVKQFNELSLVNVKLQSDLSVLEEQLSVAKANLHDDQLKFKSVELALQNELTKEVCRYVDLERTSTLVMQKYEEAKKGVALQQQQIEEWKTKVKNATADELADLRRQCQERDAHIGLLSYSLESMQAESKAAENRVSAQNIDQIICLTAEKDILTVQLKELQEQSQDWKRKLNEAEQFEHQLNKTGMELQHLKTQLLACQQRCDKMQTLNERLNTLQAETEREHILVIKKLTYELEEMQNRMRSEQSFAEKEQQINELEINLKTIKTEEVVRRKKYLSEKDDLLTRNQQLTLENDELRGKVNKDRKSRRYSSHDETRMSMFSQLCNLNTQTVQTQTCSTDTLCSCNEMDAKLKVLQRDLKIKECQIGGLNMKLEHHPMLSENIKLRKEIKKYDLELDNQRMEIELLKSQARAHSVVVKSQCAVCIERENSVVIDREQQTDTEPRKVINMSSYNGSALITEEQNCVLRSELLDIRKKYELTKKICRSRASEIEELKQQLANGVMSSFANENPEVEDLKRIIDEMEEELTLLKEKFDKDLKTHSLGNESEQMAQLKAELNSTRDLLSEIRQKYKDLNSELEKLKEKYEATKIVCKAKSRRLKDMELKQSAINQL